MRSGSPLTAVESAAVVEGWPEEVVGTGLPVPVLDGTMRSYVNLDSAASTAPLVAVRAAVDRFAPWYSSVHRGTGFKSQVSTRAYEAARQAVQAFVGADPDRQAVVFVRNTTEGLNKVARALAPSKPVVFTTIIEHHANLLPWQTWASEVRFIQVDAAGRLDLEDLERQLRDAPTDRPRLVALAGAYNVTGYTPPIHTVARLAHQYGARILVDGAQLVPHRPLTLQGSGPGDELDFLVFSGHKIYAPYGGGALVAPRDVFTGTPGELGGGIVDLVLLDRVLWAELPEREEAGSPNVMGVVALHAALHRLQAIGMDRVAQHERDLTAYALKRFEEIPGLVLLGPASASERVGVLAFRLEGISHMLAASILGMEWAVGVRAGCFCAHPGMLHLLQVPPEQMLCYVDQIQAHNKEQVPGAIRASLGLASTRADIDRLVEGLLAIVGGQYQGQYQLDRATGEYTPAGWAPELDAYFAAVPADASTLSSPPEPGHADHDPPDSITNEGGS